MNLFRHHIHENKNEIDFRPVDCVSLLCAPVLQNRNSGIALRIITATGVEHQLELPADQERYIEESNGNRPTMGF